MSRPRRTTEFRILGLCLLVAVGLAGCASGAATDARRGQEEAAVEGGSLPALQATRTAQRFFPPTSTPAPTPPAAPTLESLVITLGLGAGDAPLGQYAGVPADAGTAYAGALLHNLRAGQVVTASWASADGVPVATSEVRITTDAAQRWVALPLALNGSLLPGEYSVFVAVDDRWLTSIVFRVLPVGSGAQRLPDPPSAVNVDEDRPREDQPAESGETIEEGGPDESTYVEPDDGTYEEPVDDPYVEANSGVADGSGEPIDGIVGGESEVPIVPVTETP